MIPDADFPGRRSNVHIADMAGLYLLALEKAPSGSVHASLVRMGHARIAAAIR